MKVGDKYVIEIEEIIRGYGNAEDDHVHEPIARIKGFNTLVFDQYGLEKLEPYKDTTDAYDKGLEDAWEAVRKIIEEVVNGGYSSDVLREIFGTSTVQSIFTLNTASEAIAKIKEYEDKQKKQDAEIKVGDEVIDYLGYKGVITKSRKGDSEFVQWMRYDGHTYGSPEGSLVKTGRHFPQIAEVLEELRGEE